MESGIEVDAPRSPAVSRQRLKIRNIAELAKMAGVSAGTVSRALAGKSIVNPQTRERIQALAREHGFRLNQMASNLRTRRTGVIGLVIPLGHEQRQHVSDPFFMTFLGLIVDRLTENGYDLMLSRVVPQDPDWLERITESGMLDGVLLIGQSDQYETIERVAATFLPMVVWGAHRDGQRHCSVGTDNRAGGRMAAEHLIARGCRRLAFLGDMRPPEIGERFHGAAEAVDAAGLDALVPMPVRLAVDEMVPDIIREFARIEGVDGILAASDVIAMRALRVLADRSIGVPHDIAMIGFDDLPLADQTVPRLSTIHQDLARGATYMVDSLFKRIAGEETPSLVMPPSFVQRDSA